MSELLTIEELKAATTSKKRPAMRESHIQRACITWFRSQPKYRELWHLLFAIPNGGKRSAREASRMKEEGVTAGVPDLMLAVPVIARNGPPSADLSGLFIELKSPGGKLTDLQRAMHERLIAQGYQVDIVHSVDEFITSVTKYLG